mmetsp:Transcript_16714/g.38274  ORF Transcript_16714/g.38274 Transcript_16714/m.38274 type:complete len:392 (+) Transcript_16714:389-1564(+)
MPAGQRRVVQRAGDLLRGVHRAEHVDDEDAALARPVGPQPLVGRLHPAARHAAPLLVLDRREDVRPAQPRQQRRRQRVRGARLLGVDELAGRAPPAAHLEALPHLLVARRVLDLGQHHATLMEVLVPQRAQQALSHERRRHLVERLGGGRDLATHRILDAVPRRAQQRLAPPARLQPLLDQRRHGAAPRRGVRVEGQRQRHGLAVCAPEEPARAALDPHLAQLELLARQVERLRLLEQPARSDGQVDERAAAGVEPLEEHPARSRRLPALPVVVQDAAIAMVLVERLQPQLWCHAQHLLRTQPDALLRSPSRLVGLPLELRQSVGVGRRLRALAVSRAVWRVNREQAAADDCTRSAEAAKQLHAAGAVAEVSLLHPLCDRCAPSQISSSTA